MDFLSSLKNLYKFNSNNLEIIEEQIVNNINKNNIYEIKEQVDNLIQQQAAIRNQIPKNNHSVVSNFLIQIYSRINSMFNKNVNTSNYVNNTSNYVFDNHVNEDILKNIDPYKLYGFRKGQKITLEELKAKYKKFALDTHPDRNNGNTKNFNIINQAYKIINEDIKLKEKDKQYNELKNNSLDFLESQEKQNYTNTNLSKDDFNINKFNKVYSENKIHSAYDDGYGDWSQDNSFETEDIKRDKTINTGNFNRIFDSNIKVSKSIVKHSKPKELFMNDDNNVQELGQDKIDNYTGKTKSINFTDYKEAHTTNRLVDTNIKFKSYKDINELEHTRSNIKELSEEEKMEIEQEQIMEEKKENERMNRLSNFDKIISKNYSKVNRIMLNK